MTTPAPQGTAPRPLTLIRSLRRADIVFFIVAVVVSMDSIGLLGSSGGEGVVWIVFLSIAFLIPNALVFAETSGAFAEEGGPYAWVRRAFGRRAAAIASVLYWVTNPIWLGGSLSFIAEAVWSQFVSPIEDGSAGDYLFKIVFVWVAILLAVVSLRRGKTALTIGALAKLAVLVILCGTAVASGLSHGFPGASGGSFAPTVAGFLAIVPVALFALSGFEAPTAAADEMHDAQRDTPIAIFRGGAITAAAYILPVLAIVLMTPPDELADAGILPAIRAGFDVFGPAADPIVAVLAVAFVVALLAQGAGWMISTDRIQAVAAADGSFFNGFFGRFDPRWGTPVRMNVLSGIISTIFCVAAMTFVEGPAQSIFAVVLTTAVSTLLFSYLIIVPALIRLRFLEPDRPRPFRVPGGNAVFTALALVQLAFIVLGTWAAVLPGTLESVFGIGYSFEDQWGVSQANYEAFTLGTLAVVIGIGMLGHAFGGRLRRRLAAAGSEYVAFTAVDAP